MKTLKFFGLTLVLSVFLLPALAAYSTITDKEAGQAADIVETNNVIHVYRYLGASSEATFLSTFDEGEQWYEMAPKPMTVYPVTTRPESRSVTETSSYVEAIDRCVEQGDAWDFKTDTCRDLP